MTESPVRQQLDEELRKLLLQAAAGAGANTDQMADRIADKIVRDLRPELERIAGEIKPELRLAKEDRDALIEGLRDALVKAVKSGDIALPPARHGGEFLATGSDLDGSGVRADKRKGSAMRWESAKAVALSALGTAILLAVIVAVVALAMLSSSASTAAAPSADALPQKAVAGSAQDGWSALAGEFPFGANLPKSLACREDAPACDNWKQVRARLEETASDNRTYVAEFGDIVRTRSQCNAAMPPLASSSDTDPFLDQVEACLEQTPVAGD